MARPSAAKRHSSPLRARRRVAKVVVEDPQRDLNTDYATRQLMQPEQMILTKQPRQIFAITVQIRRINLKPWFLFSCTFFTSPLPCFNIPPSIPEKCLYPNSDELSVFIPSPPLDSLIYSELLPGDLEAISCAVMSKVQWRKLLCLREELANRFRL